MTDYHPLIARAVEGLGNSTGEARRALYERARAALVDAIAFGRAGAVGIGNHQRAPGARRGDPQGRSRGRAPHAGRAEGAAAPPAAPAEPPAPPRAAAAPPPPPATPEPPPGRAAARRRAAEPPRGRSSRPPVRRRFPAEQAEPPPASSARDQPNAPYLPARAAERAHAPWRRKAERLSRRRQRGRRPRLRQRQGGAVGARHARHLRAADTPPPTMIASRAPPHGAMTSPSSTNEPTRTMTSRAARCTSLEPAYESRGRAMPRRRRGPQPAPAERSIRARTRRRAPMAASIRLAVMASSCSPWSAAMISWQLVRILRASIIRARTAAPRRRRRRRRPSQNSPAACPRSKRAGQAAEPARARSQAARRWRNASCSTKRTRTIRRASAMSAPAIWRTETVSPGAGSRRNSRCAPISRFPSGT